MKRAATTLLLWLAAAASPAAEIAFEPVHTGDIGLLITVRGEVGGRPVRWLVDSGSSHHLVSPAVPATPAVPAEEVRVAAAAGTLQAAKVTLADARVGDQPLPAGPVLQVDLRPALGPLADRIDGILGLPWLDGRRVEVDVPNRRLRLDPPPAPHYLPLERVQGLPVVTLRVGDRDERYLVDTGAAGALVRVRLFGWGIDARRLAALRLGSVSRREVPVVDVPGGALARALSLRVAGSLGMAVLDGCRFTLDLAEDRLSIHACEREALRGGFGLQWSVADGRLVVVQVWPDSPAARAGVKRDDIVLSIDGVPAATDVPAADAALYRSDRIAIEIERDGERRTSTLERAYFLPLR